MSNSEKKTRNLKLTSQIILTIAITTMIAAIVSTQYYRRDTIIIGTMATTGPDYSTTLGHLKLYSQMPDSVNETSVWGVMIARDYPNPSFSEYLSNNWRRFAYNDKFIVRYKMIGVEQSDGSAYHPQIQIIKWKPLSSTVYHLFICFEIFIFILWIIYRRKYKLSKHVK